MPLTFLAHQAPLLPLARRSNRVDSVTLLAGTMAPDLAYVFDDTRFEFWAHDPIDIVVWGVPVSLLVSFVVVRLLAPVIPDHLPNLGPFRLRDYRGVSTHRFHLWPSVLGALVGTASHVFLDSFTHGWGWLAKHWTWYRSDIGIDLPGEPGTPFGLVQMAGHVGLSALCLVMLLRLGRQRWLTDRALSVPSFPVSTRSSTLLVGGAFAGACLTLAWEATHVSVLSSAIIRMAVTVTAGVAIAAWLALRIPGAKVASWEQLARQVPETSGR